MGAGVAGVDVTSTGLWLVEKKSEGQLERGADLEMQTFPMESRQPWARHKDVPCPSKSRTNIMVCLNDSLPLSNTLSQRPFSLFASHQRSNTSS